MGAAIAAVLAVRFGTPEGFAVLVAAVVFLGIALSLVGARVPIAPGSLFGEGAYVPPARFSSMREAFPTFDWFVRLSENASLRSLRD